MKTKVSEIKIDIKGVHVRKGNRWKYMPFSERPEKEGGYKIVRVVENNEEKKVIKIIRIDELEDRIYEGNGSNKEKILRERLESIFLEINNLTWLSREYPPYFENIYGYTYDKENNSILILCEFLPINVKEAMEQVNDPKKRLEYAIKIIIEAAKGLRIMHRERMIHKDIKPQNLMISRKGRVKIIDLGEVEDQIRGNRNMGGTLQYVAPESSFRALEGAEELLGKISEKTDVYSLALTLVKILGGDTKRITERVSFSIEGNRLENVSAAELPKLPKEYEDLSNIIERAIRLNQSERYTLDEFVNELERYARRKGINLRWVQLRDLVNKEDRERNRLKIIIPFLIGASIFGGLYIATQNREQIEKKLEQIVTEVKNLEPTTIWQNEDARIIESEGELYFEVKNKKKDQYQAYLCRRTTRRGGCVPIRENGKSMYIGANQQIPQKIKIKRGKRAKEIPVEAIVVKMKGKTIAIVHLGRQKR